MARVFATLNRLGLAALAAAVPALLLVLVLGAAWGDGKLASLVTLLLAGAVLLGSYVALALALRVREVRELASMVRARVRR